ncbi:MAG: acyl-ACP--UDP-N-acetylglucosamine O-acyltransferase [Synergistaceae bacterium]
MSLKIHSTAIVSSDAILGEDVIIGPYCIVDGKTEIGDRTELRAYARICDYTKVGSDCVFHEHAVIGGAPQDLGYRGEESWAIVGNNVVCREFVTINRATGEGEITSVGDGCFIMEGVHLAHNVRIGRECTIANKAGLSGHVHVGDYVVIGGMTGFHQFAHVGSYCMVGGLSRIIQDIPPYTLAAGVPLRVYDINRVGLRRRDISSETRRQIRDMYRIIYNSGLTVKDGVAHVAAKYPDNEAANMIVGFAAESIRGFTPRMTQDWQNKGEDKKID